MLESFEVPVYERLREEGAEFALLQAPGDTLDLVIDGGEEISGQTVARAAQLPPTIRLTSHDPFGSFPLRFGTPITVGWVPTGDADDTMQVGVLGEVDGVVAHVLDADGFLDLTDTLTQASIDLGRFPSVFLSRTRRRTAQIAEGVVNIVTSTRLYLYGDFVAPFEVEPRVLGPGRTQALTVRWWDGDIDAEDFELTIAGLPIEELAIDPSGHVAQGVVNVPANAALGPRAVTLRTGDEALVAEAGVYVAAELRGSGDCESTVEEGQVADGTWRGDLFGLDDGGYDTESCLGLAYGGGDQVIPLRLEAGETLTANLVEEIFGASLYLVRACGDDARPLSCFGTVGFGQPQTLVYTSPARQDVLLVVDTALEQEESAPGCATSGAAPSSAASGATAPSRAASGATATSGSTAESAAASSPTSSAAASGAASSAGVLDPPSSQPAAHSRRTSAGRGAAHQLADSSRL